MNFSFFIISIMFGTYHIIRAMPDVSVSVQGSTVPPNFVRREGAQLPPMSGLLRNTYRQVSSMIHSARPIVTPVTNIVFCYFVFLDLKSGNRCTKGRSENMCENNDPYRPWLWVGRMDQYRQDMCHQWSIRPDSQSVSPVVNIVFTWELFCFVIRSFWKWGRKDNMC